ncbi:hypothetical protein E2P86_09270 [Sphingobacterium psychroaquaticum]|uniref:hypothetical protein n=1 Tax=Sphingobacterium psychroaquaticum TaxID=561061 RepID=UPI0010693C08|nr:hypothetical protein [Sphingobacterium psychroaquaticum]QBQ41335.1 hypothetical protein E2P86_09270 [Sphingobacterium psychroaquaticum]
MKKLFKVVKIAFLSILAILAAGLLYFVISNKLFLGNPDKEYTAYLSKNKYSIASEIPTAAFDSTFNQADIYLLGEIHGYAANQVLDKQLLLFLNKKLGIKYYIAEMDSTTAQQLNTFLAKDSKDEELLQQVVLAIRQRIPQQASKELMEKWSDIYTYNKQLPDSSKITVLGIDKDFNDKRTTITRDSAMVANLQQMVQKQKLHNEKLYGLFGLYHVLQQTPQAGHKPLAAGLKQAGFKTISFISQTLDSDMYLPKNPQFPTPPDEKINWVNADGPLMLVKGINDLKTLTTPNTVTLFKLDASDSPYRQSQQLSRMKSTIFGTNIVPKNGSVTTDFFQYVFLLRNSKALTKLP